jgi:hypothetical protein
MGVLEIVIISLIVMLFFTINGISIISRLLSWIVANVERELFGNSIDDDDEDENK